MQNRVCKYLRHPTQAFRIPARGEVDAARRMDTLEIDLCVWSQENLPPYLQRQLGASLKDNDCDVCPLFDPVATPEWR